MNNQQISNTICISKNCKETASYGLLFEDHIHCSTHYKYNEYQNNKPICSKNKCDKIPCYTDNNENYPIRCAQHKLSRDRYKIDKCACNSCGLSFYMNSNSDCNDCSRFFYRKVNKSYTYDLESLLDKNGFKFFNDTMTQYGYDVFKHDYIIECNKYLIIIECDENQHKHYSEECEQARMIALFKSYKDKHLTFIRYNPNNYLNQFGNIKKGFSIENNNRLINLIKSLKSNPPNDPLTVVYLCYDDDNDSDEFKQIKINIEPTKPKLTIKSNIELIKPKLTIKSNTKTIKPKLTIKSNTEPIKPRLKMKSSNTT